LGDDISDIRQFYDDAAEKESLRLERHQLEYDMTWRYLDKYLPRQGKILELGAAAGAYTIPLGRRGYNVTAVDFSPNLVDMCKKRVKEEGVSEKVACVVADARDLSAIPAVDFDVALIMGPLYHLILTEDRQQALQEAFRRLKRGGLIFSTFISRYGIWSDVMMRLPHYIELQKDVQSVLYEGKDADLAYQRGNFRGYFATSAEVAPLHERVGFKTLVLAGIETAGVRDEAYNVLQSKRREMWLNLLFSISTEKSIIGASNHLLYIGEKE